MSKARGKNRSTGLVEGNVGLKPKIRKATSTMLRTKNPASQKRLKVAFLIQDIPFDAQSTMTGTMVSSANAFVQKRSALMDRYPRPQPVRTTPAASRNEVAKGAMRTPNSTKMKTPRTLSNTLVGRTNFPMQNAPIKASLVLVASQAAAVERGTPAWSCASKWAGTTASSSAHHTLRGANSRRAKKIALGGQKAEFG
jgi:hypothetical protein